MLRMTPTAVSVDNRFEPPNEMNGNGTPVSGARPNTAERLRVAVVITSVVKPTATRFPKGSVQRRAIVYPAQPKTAYSEMVAMLPTSPSSSAMTAKIMSVVASGR